MILGTGVRSKVVSVELVRVRERGEGVVILGTGVRSEVVSVELVRVRERGEGVVILGTGVRSELGVTEETWGEVSS